MNPVLLQSPEHVLSTLNADGSRRWLKPRLAIGRFLRARRAVAWFLIALFTLLPHLRINGKPAVLLDILHREFTVFGKTFLPTDTFLLMLLVAGGFVTIFLLTALLGRVWCGWGCPQTVYLEFVYRPIERLMLGAPGRAAPTRFRGLRRTAMYALYFVISFALANTFLAYFVGTNELAHWMLRSPTEHPTGFIVVAATTGLMLFNFGFFREQTCILACPYGRFQSVLLDQDSLIISYDVERGEPRGRAKRPPVNKPLSSDVALTVLNTPASSQASTPHVPASLLDHDHAHPHIHGQPDTCCGDCKGQGSCGNKASTTTGSVATGTASSTAVAASPAKTNGDCVDCGLCSAVCPTGIDIRNGLQLECVGCAQCIDACEDVMTKLHRPKGLIRYSTQHAMQHKKASLRPRLVLYPVVLLIIASLFVWRLLSAADLDISIVRMRGAPYSATSTGEIANSLTMHLTNRAENTRAYRISLSEADIAAGVKIAGEPALVSLEPGQRRDQPLTITLPVAALTNGARDVQMRLLDEHGQGRSVMFHMLGPGVAPASTPKHYNEKSSDKPKEQVHRDASDHDDRHAPAKGNNP